jgi:hypothetical protein
MMMIKKKKVVVVVVIIIVFIIIIIITILTCNIQYLDPMIASNKSLTQPQLDLIAIYT